jgi:hypothetical protein
MRRPDAFLRPPGQRVFVFRERYVGPIPHLRGKTAFVQPRTGDPGQVMAQFEELYLEEARDWWQFAAADFEGTAGSHFAN